MGRTKQALKRTADIHHPRMTGCLIVTRRVGEGSRTHALDLTRQRTCVRAYVRTCVRAYVRAWGQAAPVAVGWDGLLKNRRLGTTHGMLLVWL